MQIIGRMLLEVKGKNSILKTRPFFSEIEMNGWKFFLHLYQLLMWSKMKGDARA